MHDACTDFFSGPIERPRERASEIVKPCKGKKQAIEAWRGHWFVNCICFSFLLFSLIDYRVYLSLIQFLLHGRPPVVYPSHTNTHAPTFKPNTSIPLPLHLNPKTNQVSTQQSLTLHPQNAARPPLAPSAASPPTKPNAQPPKNEEKEGGGKGTGKKSKTKR